MKGKEIRQLRESLKLNQTQLGELLGGVHQVVISGWENGVHDPLPVFQRMMLQLAEKRKKKQKK